MYQQSLVFPFLLRNKQVIFIIQIITGSLIMAISAQINIPFLFVPLTGQSLGLIIVALSMKRHIAVTSMILYLLEGAIGLPVFAGGTSIINLMSPTGGYLWGLIPSAFVIASLNNHPYFKTSITSVITVFLGLIVLFSVGLIQLSFFVPLHMVLNIGLYPFLLGELIKICLLTMSRFLYHLLKNQ
ncbi:MAG: biotin transporter BioY [Brevinema sp.]